MKSFDAVKTMSNIRDRLSERYREDAKRQTEDLRRIREKYNISLSQTNVERPKIAEDAAKYGDIDPES